LVITKNIQKGWERWFARGVIERTLGAMQLVDFKGRR